LAWSQALSRQQALAYSPGCGFKQGAEALLIPGRSIPATDSTSSASVMPSFSAMTKRPAGKGKVACSRRTIFFSRLSELLSLRQVKVLFYLKYLFRGSEQVRQIFAVLFFCEYCSFSVIRAIM
jgi:hypothetical protein